MKNPYEELEDRFKRMDALNGALSMLYWDMSAMMPPGGVESRSEQLAVLKTLHHSMIHLRYLIQTREHNIQVRHLLEH